MEEEDYGFADCQDGVEEMEYNVDEQMVGDRSEGPSTYESISEIVLDRMTGQPNADAYGELPTPLTKKPKIGDEGCTSADITSLSYNTVPEELYMEPPKEEHEPQASNAVPGSSSSGEEDSRREEEEEVNSKCRPTSRSPSKTSPKRSKGSRSRSRTKKPKLTASKREKLKQKFGNKGNGKVVSQRDLIKPETQMTFDPDAPKRPLTAFKLFMNEFRSKYAVQYPNISFAEMTDIGAEVWRDMPAEKKSGFQETANNLQDEYLNQMKNYQSKKQQEKQAKPKTGYQIFMSDHLNKEYEKRKNLKTQSTLTKQDLFMRGVRKWNRMTKTQKKLYEEQSKITKEIQSTKTSAMEHLPKALTILNSQPSPSPPAPPPDQPASPSTSSCTEPPPVPPAPTNQTETSCKKNSRHIEFSDEDEVGQFTSDETLETWYQAAKGGHKA